MKDLFLPTIDENTNFLVFDLEWNQPCRGVNFPFDTHKFNGEIIEIGAVKLKFADGELVMCDKLSVDVKPRYYRVLHSHVKKVINKTDADLNKGISFEESYKKFTSLMDENTILVAWGRGDITMLKLNLELLGLEIEIKHAFIDLQPIFSKFIDKRSTQRSVEYAVNYLEIEKRDDFHSAYADAYYEATIMARLYSDNDKKQVVKCFSTDAINPDVMQEFTRISDVVKNPFEVYKDKENWNKVCPFCNKNNKVVISQFRLRKSAYALYHCEEHGNFFVRTKLRRDNEGLYYGATIKRIGTTNDLLMIENYKKEYDVYGSEGQPKELKVLKKTSS